MADSTEQLLQQFRDEALLNRYASSTMKNRVAWMRRFLRWYGDDIANLTRADVVRFLLHLRNEPAKGRGRPKVNSTINAALKSLKQFSRWCYGSGYMIQDPTLDLKGLREDDRIRLAPIPEDVTALLKVASTRPYVTDEQHARDYLMVLICADTGLRIGELIGHDDLVGVTLTDILKPNGEIVSELIVHGKGAKDRVVAITEPVERALRQYLTLRRGLPGVEHLLVNQNGSQMGERNTEKLMRMMRERAGVEIQWHDLRRFAFSEMWELDIDDLSLDTLSGHTDARTRQRYIRRAIVRRALRRQREVSPAVNVLAL